MSSTPTSTSTSTSIYLGNRTRIRLLELGGRSPSYQDVMGYEAENLRKRLLSGPTIDIYVGNERRCWTLHKNLLCHHSSYFEEIEKEELHLPDHDPQGFELLVKWLYQGQLEDASHLSDEAKYDYAVACHKLYLLCDTFDMTKLKNIAMDQYRQCLNDTHLVPDAEEINDIYRTSPIASPFRDLMVRIAARQIMDPDTDRDAEAYRKCFQSDPDFAVEMINAIRYMSGGILFEDPTSGHQCTYHDHNDVSGCPYQGKEKGKAKTMNGQGHTPSTNPTQNGEYLSLPELSAEKRTPRKLNSTPRADKTAVPAPKTSPVANQSIRRQSAQDIEQAHSIEPAHSPDPRRATPRKLEKRSPPRPNETSLQPSEQRHPPLTNGVKPLYNRPQAISTNGTTASTPLPTPTPSRPRKAVSPEELFLPNGTTHPTSPLTNGADPDTQSTTSHQSRKRKFEPRRTPRKLKSAADLDRPKLGRSITSTSSAASRASGPRKLSRVSSVVKLNGDVVDEKSQTSERRKPVKLRVSS